VPEKLTDIPATNSRVEQTFPTFSRTQLDRVTEHGHLRPTRQGEVLIEHGQLAVSFFVVLAGELQTVRPTASSETLVSRTGPGQFTGEVNTLSGRPALFQTRVAQAGQVIELDRQAMCAEPTARLAEAAENCRNHPASTRRGGSYGVSRLNVIDYDKLAVRASRASKRTIPPAGHGSCKTQPVTSRRCSTASSRIVTGQRRARSPVD
jgi:hypothetical protein